MFGIYKLVLQVYFTQTFMKGTFTWQLCKKDSQINQLKQKQMTTFVKFQKSKYRQW